MKIGMTTTYGLNTYMYFLNLITVFLRLTILLKTDMVSDTDLLIGLQMENISFLPILKTNDD